MAVRSVQVIGEDNTVEHTTVTTSAVERVTPQLNVMPVATMQQVKVIPSIGQNIANNIHVGTLPPSEPFEGQIWVDIS
jgi:hypothetical protein